MQEHTIHDIRAEASKLIDSIHVGFLVAKGPKGNIDTTRRVNLLTTELHNQNYLGVIEHCVCAGISDEKPWIATDSAEELFIQVVCYLRPGHTPMPINDVVTPGAMIDHLESEFGALTPKSKLNLLQKITELCDPDKLYDMKRDYSTKTCSMRFIEKFLYRMMNEINRSNDASRQGHQVIFPKSENFLRTTERHTNFYFPWYIDETIKLVTFGVSLDLPSNYSKMAFNLSWSIYGRDIYYGKNKKSKGSRLLTVALGDKKEKASVFPRESTVPMILEIPGTRERILRYFHLGNTHNESGSNLAQNLVSDFDDPQKYLSSLEAVTKALELQFTNAFVLDVQLGSKEEGNEKTYQYWGLNHDSNNLYFGNVIGFDQKKRSVFESQGLVDRFSSLVTSTLRSDLLKQNAALLETDRTRLVQVSYGEKNQAAIVLNPRQEVILSEYGSDRFSSFKMLDFSSNKPFFDAILTTKAIDDLQNFLSSSVRYSSLNNPGYSALLDRLKSGATKLSLELMRMLCIGKSPDADNQKILNEFGWFLAGTISSFQGRVRQRFLSENLKPEKVTSINNQLAIKQRHVGVLTSGSANPYVIPINALNVGVSDNSSVLLLDRYRTMRGKNDGKTRVLALNLGTLATLKKDLSCRASSKVLDENPNLMRNALDWLSSDIIENQGSIPPDEGSAGLDYVIVLIKGTQRWWHVKEGLCLDDINAVAGSALKGKKVIVAFIDDKAPFKVLHSQELKNKINDLTCFCVIQDEEPQKPIIFFSPRRGATSGFGNGFRLSFLYRNHANTPEQLKEHENTFEIAVKLLAATNLRGYAAPANNRTKGHPLLHLLGKVTKYVERSESYTEKRAIGVFVGALTEAIAAKACTDEQRGGQRLNEALIELMSAWRECHNQPEGNPLGIRALEAFARNLGSQDLRFPVSLFI